MGRPPIGERAMTAAEKQRRYRERRDAKLGNKPRVTKSASVDKLERRIRELEAELARRPKAQERAAIKPATRSGREFSSEEFRRQREIAGLKSDIAKLKMALQEEPDAAKLRKKVVEQRVEIAHLRQYVRKLAKERDEYKAHTKPNYREAQRLLTVSTFRAIVKPLHYDRRKQITEAELAEAERLFVALRPLFDADR
jgi:hypothetical protein